MNDLEAQKERCSKFNEDIVTNDCGSEVSPLDDDYESYRSELEDLTSPLSDDYNKYDNE